MTRTTLVVLAVSVWSCERSGTAALVGGATASTAQDALCVCMPSVDDADGDCISDAVERASGYTDPNKWDTDGDGLGDGCEDINRNGKQDVGELSARSKDTDNDGLEDGVEDVNHNGRRDPGETDPLVADAR